MKESISNRSIKSKLKNVSFIILFTLILNISCTNTRSIVSSTSSSYSSASTGSHYSNTWSDEPNAYSSKIKLVNGAYLFSNMIIGLKEKNYTIAEQSGTSITTDPRTALNTTIRIKIWIDGNDLILTSDVQEFTETEFGLPDPVGFSKCVRGDTDDLTYPDCWREIISIANYYDIKKQYK